MLVDGHAHLLDPGSPFSEHMNGDPDLLLHMLDDAGFDRAVVFAVAPHVSNDFVADACRQHPDRFVGFASVDPNARVYSDPLLAATQLEDLLTRFPFKGLKLHPRIQGFSISDPRHTAFFQRVVALGLPVLIDCISQPRSLVPLADNLPFEVDRLLRAVPGLKIILAHMGGHRVLDAYCVALAHPHVYLDLSWVIHLYQGSSVEQDIKFVVKKLAPMRRIVFGTDFPIFNREKTLPIRYSRDLCMNMFTEIELDQGEVAGIMGDTIADLLGLH
ncbi:MAG: amidohydrolase family protein [Ardenticatenaceae bacterium]|nr:amidohydrolase family protein [Ardenticatenaceae bacterium]